MKTTAVAVVAQLLGEDRVAGARHAPDFRDTNTPLKAAQAIESQLGSNDDYKPFGVVDMGEPKPAKSGHHDNPQNKTKQPPLYVKPHKPLHLSPRQKKTPGSLA